MTSTGVEIARKGKLGVSFASQVATLGRSRRARPLRIGWTVAAWAIALCVLMPVILLGRAIERSGPGASGRDLRP